MVFYRFNSLSQGLKATSAGLFNVTVTQTANGAPKYVYKPMLTAVPKAPSLALTAASSSHASHGHGHGHGQSSYSYDPHYCPKGWENWREWKSWKDVPDSLIPTTSKRDPDNTVYSNPAYINMRKKMIWYQRPVGLPVYLLNGWKDKVLIYFMWTATILSCLYVSYLHYQEIYKKYYPDSNLFYFF
jgi:hypothetical protein